MNYVGGRKALALLTILSIGVGFAFLRGDIPTQLATFLEVVFGLYVGGNVGSKLVPINRRQAETVQPQTEAAQPQVETVQPNPTKQKEESTELVENLNHINNGLGIVQELLKLIIRRSGLDRIPDKTN